MVQIQPAGRVRCWSPTRTHALLHVLSPICGARTICGAAPRGVQFGERFTWIIRRIVHSVSCSALQIVRQNISEFGHQMNDSPNCTNDSPELFAPCRALWGAGAIFSDFNATSVLPKLYVHSANCTVRFADLYSTIRRIVHVRFAIAELYMYNSVARG